MADHTLNLTQSLDLEFIEPNTVNSLNSSPSDAFMDGECPWCDEGPFERPEMHARQKHESEYESYSESE